MTDHGVDQEPTGRILPKSVLFLCGMNSIRSPMAEAIARSMLPKTWHVMSAGIRKGERDPFVDAVLVEKGLDVIARSPHTLDELEDDFFDVLIALAPEADDRAREFARLHPVELEHWHLPDPSVTTGSREQVMEAYRHVRDTLERRIQDRFFR